MSESMCVELVCGVRARVKTKLSERGVGFRARLGMRVRGVHETSNTSISVLRE